MSAEGTRRHSALNRAVLATLTATLLASCSATSDTDMAMFGFNPQYGATGVAMPQAARSATIDDGATEVAVAAPSAVPSFVFDETDPNLPEQVASVPTMINHMPAADPAVLPVEGEAQVAAAMPDTAPVEGTVQETTRTEGDASTAELQGDAQPAQTATPEPQKRGFLSAFFSQQPARATPSPIVPRQAPVAQSTSAEEVATTVETPKPIVDLAANRAPISTTAKQSRPVMISTASISENALPGVRDNANLFEISRRSGIDDDSDIDLNEDGGLYQVAYAPGLARLAPNGLLKQHDDVDVSCLRPSLVRVLKSIESRFGQKVVITSGYRSAERNRRARGARNSLHMACAAADIQVAGVSKWALAEYVRSMPGRGGVGTYCHTESVHVDVGPERDWNWRCRRRG
ncbi:D-Ala-D-Ala carboxypeptidase family metallohydrolase [Mesorhizobium sp. YIM 152430]|uniref:YcbK family protein n=1 Tax=Mesorhizobium sp. YIM 152430 TaxID=3031761 RepID=UPI0023D97AFB|nr:D-Ala-D-Ala carboxypeptidase family metallohydrolase [Mesorhizobium sp. YIM 152430]MDF1601406.1 D-Ala-D-Ala carboxypeptidase family metallohydrolase [Mesorhizobium sp. YIM 152430]